jgi:hypothetical protein
VSRRSVGGVGIILACLYVVGAIVSGHRDPLDRRPLLDGLAPPPAYQWVTPPEALAASNRPPTPKTFLFSPSEASFDPSKGSVPGVFASGNYQATLALAEGAFPPTAGATGAVLTLSPLAPAPGLSLPGGYQIAGNVMRITASYRPAGRKITRLSADAQLTLAYPVVYGIDDTIVTSSDGERWTAVRSTDHVGQQLVIGNIHHLGFFAVGQRSVVGGTSPGTSTGSGGSIPIVPIAALVGLAIVSSIIVLVLRARSKDERRPRPPRPPRREDPFDLWRE